jgi:hypothetical protein
LRLPFLILCLLCAALPLLRPARAAYDCAGDACPVTALVWEEESQRFRADNSSDQRVRVEVETFAGRSSVTVEPRQSAYLEVKTFQGPYSASFE